MENVKNGSEIISKVQDNFCEGYVVLCQRHNGEFTTWLTDNEMNTFYGNYFTSYVEAKKDFSNRVEIHCK